MIDNSKLKLKIKIKFDTHRRRNNVNDVDNQGGAYDDDLFPSKIVADYYFQPSLETQRAKKGNIFSIITDNNRARRSLVSLLTAGPLKAVGQG